MTVSILGAEPRVAVRNESERGSLVLYGSPSTGGRPVSVVEILDDLIDNPARHAKTFDGEFALSIETPQKVVLISDRFAALPLFYIVENRNLLVSFSYQAIWNRLIEQGHLQPDRLAFYTFLHFQRLFGDSTLDKTSKALPPASALVLDRATGAVEISRYWTPDFTKRTDGIKAIARDLADAIKSSVASKTREAETVALLLSGGMDSRVVLGGFSGIAPPLCVTVGASINNEVEVATSLAGVSGAEHSFVERPPTHYADILQRSTSTGGGMYSFQHGHFFGLDIPKTDLILHGHGFDYFFQGMYLPSHRKKLFGLNTRSWSLDPIGPDLIKQYIHNAPYRLKGLDAGKLLKLGLEIEAQARIIADLEAVVGPITGETSERYDEWDFLTTGAPGRHYTHLNLLSAGSLAEQRTVAFDNDIFDIYYSTPATIRHGTGLLAETIKFLNPKLLEVRNANTNLRPDLTPVRLTIESWARGARRRLGIGGSLRPDPGVNDRSWPTDSEIIRTSSSLRSRVDQLASSEGIGSLDLFDETKIHNLAVELQNGNDNVASALLTLITIDEFISQSA